ncbi:two-partner secretion domain-containing protein [Yoonia sp. 2307UL14-13]|uniref:two-partner secretion domain-containing protein n=1 Tax=Yoonia sp. 2307UL14-13 TaxID=3126506 RepID=UPI00309A1C9A
MSALCIGLITTQPLLAQQIVADENGPQVIDSHNGTPMVMINTPDANGVSHNTYTDFGVGPGGAILNNADTDTALTQLGGRIQGNSNLRGGAAGIILNEVTSTNPSVLNGFLEVGGQRADVIVANPNGITCDGCGFINTNQLTITTGEPAYTGDQFTGFSVENGLVAIGAGGLDASDTTTFDILSRQIRVGGVVQGREIRLVAGRNDVVYATGVVTEKSGEGDPITGLAIDSTVVGGMFADAITITSTEDGVGVRAPRDMAANAGGMTITADGRLVMNNASASQNMTVRSTERVVVQGDVAAQQVDVTSAEDLVLEANARLVADSAALLNVGGDLDVGANGEITATRFDLDIAGAFRIGSDADVTSVETLDVDAGSLINMGTLASTDGGLLVTTSLDLTNEGLMFGDAGLSLRSDADITNNGGTIISNNGITIRGDGNARANAFTNQFGGVVETIGGDINIAALTFNNTRAAPVIVDNDITTDGTIAPGEECDRQTCYEEIQTSDSFDYDSDRSQILSAGNITITADDVTNAYSSISAFGDITIAADTLNNIGRNYFRNDNGTAEFIGADFGVIEAGGNLDLTEIEGYIQNGAQTAITNNRAGPSNTDLSDISIDSIGNPDLVVVNRDPDAEFLVETRPEFVDLDQFVSSDYFLQAIEYDPELRRFGDAYAEALLIRKQLQELLGQLILTTGLDERAQIEAMYNNAINELENLDLTPGVALTPDQIGALTSDIIWLEETVIDGERVLAPKVYLANPEIRFAGLSGAMITGRNVDVRTRNFDNSGNIRATNNLSIAVSDTFRSTGGTISAENIAVVGNNIEIVTGAQTLVTEQGVTFFQRSGDTDREDIAVPAASLVAGSTIVLTARDAITATGARIEAGDNITLLAGGDITIGALRLASAKGDRRGSNRDYVERVDHLTTSLTADGDIMLLSSGNASGRNNIVLEGANLTAGGNVGMIAQDGDLILAAVQDFYFRDYRRKKSGAFGFNTKVRERMTTRITNEVVEIEAAAITGVADNNIYVEGSRFVIPGVAGADVAPGQLSMVSVNGSSVFAAPFDLFAETSYRKNSTAWGLINNSSTDNNAHSIARGVFADTAGDIALNSGGDLTLTAVDFNAGGQFVTKVSGTTYLLAAINQDYQFTFTHRDNGVIMTDTTVEDISESVTFNRITAAGGVNLDPDSQIVLSAIRDPLFDSAHPATWTTEAENGRSMLANAYLGIDSPAKDQGSGDDGKNFLRSLAEQATEEEEDNRHWREGGEWTEEGEFRVRQVALPTGANGAEYAYLDGVLGRDDTINEPIELVSYHFYDRQRALNPAFKALLTIAVTQGLGGLEVLQIAETLGAAANTALATGINAASTSFAATLVVETTAGVVAGDVDINAIVGAASFSGLSAGLTSGINLDTFGGSFEGMAWAETAYGFGDGLTFANLVESGIDATLTAGLNTAVHDTDFLDSFADNLEASAVNLAMADLQTGIGDGVSAGTYAEGSLPHALLHGAVGCAAAEALDGNCASGATAGIAQSVFAGLQEDAPERGDFTSDEAFASANNAWRNQLADQAEMLGALTGYLTSGGKAVNVSNAASISQSGFLNNYLKHDEIAVAQDLLAELEQICSPFGDAVACLRGERSLEIQEKLRELTATSTQNTRDMIAACEGGRVAECRAHISAAKEFLEWRYDGWNNSGRFDVGAGIAAGDLDWERNFDVLAVDVYERLMDGEIATVEAAQAEITARIARYDGWMNVGVGSLATAGVGVTCVYSLGATCYLAGAAAVVGSADELVDGVSSVATGEPVENPYVTIGQMAGLSKEDATQVEALLDTGAALVELGAGGFAILRGGRVIGRIDDAGSSAPVVRIGDGGATNTTGLTTADFPQVRTTVSQKQNRHIDGRPEYRGGGTLSSQADAQRVLDAYHSGDAVILGQTSQGFPVVRFNGVTGINNNVGAGITNQQTNVFIVKGTASPSIVPVNPNWTP